MNSVYRKGLGLIPLLLVVGSIDASAGCSKGCGHSSSKKSYHSSSKKSYHSSNKRSHSSNKRSSGCSSSRGCGHSSSKKSYTRPSSYSYSRPSYNTYTRPSTYNYYTTPSRYNYYTTPTTYNYYQKPATPAFVAKPSVKIETATNGIDADNGTGPTIAFGSNVKWTYVVRNTGNVTLTNVTVRDNKLGAICTIGSLAIGATRTCTKTGTATSGQYANVGTSTAYYGTRTITNSDPSHYKGANRPTPSINIEAATNGIDADNGSGPLVPFGKNVTWTYVVKNTGNTALNNVLVRDNKLGAICTIGNLAIGATRTCTKTGTATSGQYANLATATGNYGTQNVTDSDPSHYIGANKPAAATYSVGDLVWADNNNDASQNNGEAGISNMLLKLYKGNQVVKTTRTSIVGQYLFSNLTAGNYCVEVIKPNNYTLTTGGAKNCFTLKNNKTNVDFGLMNKGTNPKPQPNPNPQPTAGKGNVGDFVWYDRNKNGIQDAGEPGIKNKVVRLYGANGSRIRTTRTDANGKYLFKNVPNGQYFIKFTIPKKYSTSPQNQGTNTAKDSDGAANGKTALFTVASNSNLSIDMGLTKGGNTNPNPTNPNPNPNPNNTMGVGSVGDYVWYDKNKNGIQDANERGIKNKVVRLYKSNGRRVATTRTDANGKYLFNSVTNGQYYIRFTIPKKYTASPQGQGGSAAKDSDGAANGKTALFTVANNHNRSIDMGLTKGGAATPKPTNPAVTPANGTGNVGDFVWYDKNKNGIQDAGERGIKNKVVRLYKSNGRRFASTRTDANGKYLFANVPAGQYYVRFTIPKKYQASPKNRGTNTAKDSDGSANGKTALFTVANNSNLSIDMGLTKGGNTNPNPNPYKPATGNGTGIIGNFVWHDKNHNGLQDPGEHGIKNIKVTIYDVNHKVLKTTKTSPYGKYSFKNMPAGKYSIKFALLPCTQASPINVGSSRAKDSDGDNYGATKLFTFKGNRSKLNIDMGLSCMGCSLIQKKSLNVKP